MDAAIRAMAPVVSPDAIVVVKSTVPPGTADRLALRWPTIEFASVPEFLVANDPEWSFAHPDRLVVGAASDERGFGGACLPKDLDGLIAESSLAGYHPRVLKAISDFNRSIRDPDNRGEKPLPPVVARTASSG